MRLLIAAQVGPVSLIDNSAAVGGADDVRAVPRRTDARRANSKGPGEPMRRRMMKSKIHRATVTGANLHYVGSVSIDTELMALADILPYEQVPSSTSTTAPASRPTPSRASAARSA